jgi:hypothetical protein
VQAAGQAQEIVVARDDVAVRGQRGAAEALGGAEIAAASLGHRGGAAQGRALVPPVAARHRLQEGGQPGRIVAHEQALDRALRLIVARGRGAEHLAPQLERDRRRLRARVAQLGGAAAVRQRQSAGARTLGQLAGQVRRRRPQLLAKEQAPAHERGQTRAPRARFTFGRGRRQERGQRRAGRLDVAELGQVVDEEIARRRRLARRRRIGLEQGQALRERVSHVDHAERGIGERDLDDQAGEVERHLGAGAVDAQAQLGGRLAIAHAVEQDVRRLDQRGRRRPSRRIGERLGQAAPVLGHGQRHAQDVVKVGRYTRVG